MRPAALTAADTRDAYGDVARVYLPIAIAVFAIVIVAMGLLVWRGRRRAVAQGPEENNPLEIAYAVGLLAIVAVLVFAITFPAQDRIAAAPRAPGPQVRVVAAKWNWRFEYPQFGIVDAGAPRRPATLTVPAGRDVRFSATSLDVLHAFWIPDRRFQRQIAPGRQTTFRLTFPRPGDLANATCSFFCGLGHGDMRFHVRVLPAAEFDAWARSGGRG